MVLRPSCCTKLDTVVNGSSSFCSVGAAPTVTPSALICFLETPVRLVAASILVNLLPSLTVDMDIVQDHTDRIHDVDLCSPMRQRTARAVSILLLVLSAGD